MRITRAFSWTAAAASVTLFGISLAAFLAVGGGSHAGESLKSSADAADVAFMRLRLRAMGGTHCAADRYEVDRRSRFMAGARATAWVRCELEDLGMDTLSGLRFAVREDLENYEQDLINYVRGRNIGGTCSGNEGESPWYDGDGRERGTLFCYAGHVAWTDRRTRAAYLAEGELELSTLLQWWELRGRGPMPQRARYERELRRLFASELVGGTSDCTRTQSAIVDAALRCGPERPKDARDVLLDSLWLYRAQTESQINALFRLYERTFHAPLAESTPDEHCDEASMVSETWPYGEAPKGEIFCFPASGSQWLLWTTKKTRTAVLMSRMDQDEGALYAAWLELP